MDHKDGDHHNNIPENIITICKVCHARKGKESGDFNSQKDSSRLHKNNNKKINTLYSDDFPDES
jgi:5-methylcytosine-specific restriction endonuclease McrA